MTTVTPEKAETEKTRFRDDLRSLPRRVWICCVGSLIVQAGSFLPTFIVFYLTQRGQGAGAAGLVLGVSGVGSVLGSFLGGYLTDSLGRQRTILLSVVTTATMTASVPFLGPFELILVVVGLIGVMSQVQRPAMAAVLADSVGPELRLAAYGVLRFAMNVGVAVSGVLGGLVAGWSYIGLFVGEALALLLFGVLVLALLRDERDQHVEEQKPGDQAEPEPDPAGSYRQALADRTLVRFLVLTVCAMLVYIQYGVGLPLHVSDVGLDAQDFGLLIGFNGVLVLALELPILSVISRYRPERVLALGTLLAGIGLALTGLTTGLVTLAITVVIWTLGEMLYASVAQAQLVALTPPGMVGRYQGLFGAAYTVGTGAGPAIGGVVYAMHPGALWSLVGVLGVLCAHLSLRLRTTSSPANAKES